MVSVVKQKIRTVVPENGITKLKQFLSHIEELIIRICASSKFTSILYYSLFSKAFWREFHGVIYGKLKYYKNLKQAKNSDYLIRRNIHRLEKGLIMKPRRNVFAKEYIEETVKSYEIAVNGKKGKSLIDCELQWAHDVLKEYFSVVGSDPKIDRARQKFLALESIRSDGKYIPYKRDLNTSLGVSYEQFLQLSWQRRSVRWYEQKPVPRELIDKAVTAAALSPSACNRQPFEFRVFDEPELIQKVASIPMGTKGFSHNFPAIVVVIGNLNAYFNERDRHVIYIDASLASMSFMYALETLGLSSCPINWPDMEPQESKMASLLNLEPDERVIMLISVGYPDPDGMVPYSQKKSLNQIRRYN
ncbi:MAG: nitroreductase family protein [Cyanobacteria bacterium J06633_8]